MKIRNRKIYWKILCKLKKRKMTQKTVAMSRIKLKIFQISMKMAKKLILTRTTLKTTTP